MKLKKKITILFVLIVLTLFLFNLPKTGQFIKSLLIRKEVQIVRHFPFSDDKELRLWEEKIFKGRVLYSIDKEDHQSFVLASSDKTASALYYKLKLDMAKRPIISWKWNAQKFPLKNFIL